MNKRLLKYELRNILGNPFVFGFGMVLPMVLYFLIAKTLKNEIPAKMIPAANAQLYVTMSLTIPLAIIFIGYASNYSQEVEKGIPQRMQLFGFSVRKMTTAKLLSELIVAGIGFFIYTLTAVTGTEIAKPQVSSVIMLAVSLILLAVIFFFQAQGFANIFRKFGPTYAVTMSLYFGTMILCGMMGIKTENLPTFAQKIAKTLPMYYISHDFTDYWEKGSYNAAPLIQSFLFIGAITCFIFLYSVKKKRA